MLAAILTVALLTTTSGSAAPVRGVAIGDDVVVMRNDGAAFTGTVTAVSDETLDLDLGGKVATFSWSDVKKVKRTASAKPRPTAHAAPAAGNDVRALVTFNPLGFLQFGPTVEAEALVGKSAGVYARGRITSLGLASYVLIDSELQSGWTAGGGFHYYPDAAKRPGGWYVGAGGEIGRSDSIDTTAEVTAAGVDFGYRWVTPKRWVVGLGAIAGAFRSDFDYKDGSPGGRIEGALLMGTVGLGRAF